MPRHAASPHPFVRSLTALAVLVVTVASLACVGGATPDRDPPPSPRIEAPNPAVSPAPVAARPARSPVHTTPSSAAAPKRPGSARPSAPNRPGPAPEGTPSSDPVQTADVPAPPVASPADSDTIRVDRARLEADLAGVQSVGEVIGLRPHITWSGIDGFVVSDLPVDSPLNGVGLQQGDVVHSVNGRSLTSIDAAWSLAETLQTADVLEGEITRDGTRQRLVVQLD